MGVLLKIKEQLKKEGRNMKWLAHKFDVSDNHVRMVLRGERPLSKANLEIVKELWPDLDISSDPLYEDHLQAKQSLKEKPLFKDDK